MVDRIWLAAHRSSVRLVAPDQGFETGGRHIVEHFLPRPMRQEDHFSDEIV
jgi:hypothetical protein